jgi:hypothetical protein
MTVLFQTSCKKAFCIFVFQGGSLAQLKKTSLQIKLSFQKLTRMSFPFFPQNLQELYQTSIFFCSKSFADKIFDRKEKKPHP